MFEKLCILGIAAGCVLGGFFFSVMFDDKQRYKCTFKDFINWLREAGTEYLDSKETSKKNEVKSES